MWFQDLSPFSMCLLGALLVFVASAGGIFPALMLSRFSARTESIMLGSSAGIMLGATFFSLLLPSLNLYKEMSHSPFWAASWVGFWILAGALGLYILHQMIPHEHLMKGVEGLKSERVARTWLVILAVGLHNLPEGFAVGVGIGSGNMGLGVTIAIAIALQDFPEGLIVALGLRTIGLPVKQIVLITCLTALIESAGVVIGYGAVSLIQNLLPASFAICAGAMLFVVSHEVIPESHRGGHEKEATTGLMIGFVLMMLLDMGLT